MRGRTTVSRRMLPSRFLMMMLAILILFGMPIFASGDEGPTVSVREERFGAKGDGLADDTEAIQKAVNWVHQKGGGKIEFPSGTYIVTSVNIREGITYEGYGATIKRPDNLTEIIGQKAAHWVRTFTTQKNKYCGQDDSKPLIIRGLTFDGSSQTQGPYQEYQLEHAALVFLVGDSNCRGRLSAIVEDCVFRNGVGDGVHAYRNTHVTMTNCMAENVFRGGFTLTGGYSVAHIKNLTTRGDIDYTGIDVEINHTSFGYGNSLRVELYLEDLKLEDGGFDVMVHNDSLVVGRNIVAEAPFNLNMDQSTAHFSDCRFGVGSGDRILWPGKTTFDRCEFFVSSRPGTRQHETLHSAVPFIVWNHKSGTRYNQRVTFNDCSVVMDRDYVKKPGTRYHGFLTMWDSIEYDNVLEVNGGSIRGTFDVGLGMSHRGGNWIVNNAVIEASLAFQWTGFKDDYRNAFSNISLRGLEIRSEKYMHIGGYGTPKPNRIYHHGIMIEETANVLSSDYGLEGNTYLGKRIIIGKEPPTARTHCLPGDIYRRKDDSQGWVCTKPGYYHTGTKRNIPSKWRVLPLSANHLEVHTPRDLHVK